MPQAKHQEIYIVCEPWRRELSIWKDHIENQTVEQFACGGLFGRQDTVDIQRIRKKESGLTNTLGQCGRTWDKGLSLFMERKMLLEFAMAHQLPLGR